MADQSEASGSGGRGKDTVNYKIFNDSVHGHIKMHPLLVEIIDTPEFQRLRNIKQLGGGYYVFPGASHNRFEHSIGVAHLAGDLVRNLKAQGNYITDKDELCVQIAGLCHDLGHGPFSHVFEVFMKEVKHEPKWEHEAASVKMFEQLITREIRKKNEKYTIENIMKTKYKFEGRDIVFIEELIYGPNPPTELFKKLDPLAEPWLYKGREKKYSYLYEIVANKRTGIDVDKMDYFTRDCLHLGIKSNFSHERYVMFARVCTIEKEENQICMRDKEALNMYELFHVRYLLHHNVYQHRVTKAIEMMIVDALLEAEKDFKLDGKKISEIVSNQQLYLKLTDNILQDIKLQSQDEKEIIERIERRDLYSLVGSKLFKHEELKDLSTTEKKKELLQSWLRSISQRGLRSENFRVQPIKIDYGMKEKNPIKSLRFYTKNNEKEAKELKDEVSYILPGIFNETKVMLFSTNVSIPKLSEVEIEKFWEIIKKEQEQQQQTKKTMKKDTAKLSVTVSPLTCL